MVDFLVRTDVLTSPSLGSLRQALAAVLSRVALADSLPALLATLHRPSIARLVTAAVDHTDHFVANAVCFGGIFLDLLPCLTDLF